MFSAGRVAAEKKPVEIPLIENFVCAASDRERDSTGKKDRKSSFINNRIKELLLAPLTQRHAFYRCHASETSEQAFSHHALILK